MTLLLTFCTSTFGAEVVAVANENGDTEVPAKAERSRVDEVMRLPGMWAPKVEILKPILSLAVIYNANFSLKS